MPPVSVTMHAWKSALPACAPELEDEADEEVDEPVELDELLLAVDFEPQPAAARATTAAVAAILVMLVVRTAPPPVGFEFTATMWTTVDSVSRPYLLVSQFSACGATSQYTCDPGTCELFRHDRTTLPGDYGAHAPTSGKARERDITGSMARGAGLRC
jgi:hypothetical protein